MYSEGSSNASISSVIPLDLWLQIFGFFPVKTLLVFRAVCKSFLSIIEDPYFVSLHRGRFPKNALESRFLIYQVGSNGLVCQVHEIHDLYTPLAKGDLKTIDHHWVKKPAMDPSSCWNVVCSLDGLVLLSNTESYHYSRTRTSATLWNPSIKKHRRLDLPLPEARNFGLGYDPLSKDYKVVALHESGDQAWVYSVKTKSWTEVLDRRFRGCDATGLRRFAYSSSVFCKERVVWMEITSYVVAPYECRLVWFDFETERFHYVDEMPSSAILKLVMLDGGSTIGVWHWHGYQVFVWALETDDKSWTLRYKLAHPTRDMLTLHTEQDSSGYHLRFADRSRLHEKNGELVWRCWTDSGGTFNVSTYKIDVATQVYRRKDTRIVPECLDLYVESLVMAS